MACPFFLVGIPSLQTERKRKKEREGERKKEKEKERKRRRKKERESEWRNGHSATARWTLSGTEDFRSHYRAPL